MSTQMYGSHLLEKNLLLEESSIIASTKFAVKVLNGEETVGHLPRKFSRIAWYFLACGGSISVEVSIIIIQPLFTLGSVYSTSASGAEQTIETDNSNIT